MSHIIHEVFNSGEELLVQERKAIYSGGIVDD